MSNRVAAVLFLLGLSFAFAREVSAQGAAVCTPGTGTTVVHVNGVFKNRMQANANRLWMERIWRQRLLSIGIGESDTKFELAYNPTAGLINDIVETIAQAYPDVPVEFIRDALSIAAIVRIPNPAVRRDIVEMLVEQAGAQPRADVLADHLAQYRRALASGRRLILVPHSQGNLFVIEALNSANGLTHRQQANVGVIAVASPVPYPGVPPSASIKRILNEGDLVIYPTAGYFNPTFAWFYPPDDWSGHGFQETYLSGHPPSGLEYFLSAATGLVENLPHPERCVTSHTFTHTSVCTLGSGVPSASACDAYPESSTEFLLPPPDPSLGTVVRVTVEIEANVQGSAACQIGGTLNAAGRTYCYGRQQRVLDLGASFFKPGNHLFDVSNLVNVILPETDLPMPHPARSIVPFSTQAAPIGEQEASFLVPFLSDNLTLLIRHRPTVADGPAVIWCDGVNPFCPNIGGGWAFGNTSTSVTTVRYYYE